MTSLSYLVFFPNKSTLEAFSKSSDIELSIHGIKAKVSKSYLIPGAPVVLQTGWLKIFNIPNHAWNVETVKLIEKLAGEVVVDELSLIREGLVCVKISSRCINKIRG